MPLPLCGLLILGVLLNSLGWSLEKETNLINSLLGKTLLQEMEKPLLWLRPLPGESDWNSRWTSPQAGSSEKLAQVPASAVQG